MIKNSLQNKSVLVTGGTGSIGCALVAKILRQKPKLVKIFARDEYAHWVLEKELEEQFPEGSFLHIIGDVRDERRMLSACAGVDIVFHTAGLKHVPYAEQNPEEAFEINVQGGRNVIHAAAQSGVRRVVAISTDKAVNPTSVMGISKLLMERLFIADWSRYGFSTQFSVVRMGNIMNTRGSVIQRWIEQAGAGHPISVTDKSMRRFMISIDQATDFILTASDLMLGREIFVPHMNELNMFDLAQEIIKEHADGKEIEIVFTGMREREKISEALFTADERILSLEKSGCRVILPNTNLINERKNAYE